MTREQAFTDAMKFTQEKFDEGFHVALHSDCSDYKSSYHGISWYKRWGNGWTKVDERQCRYE